jgi:hypothetical protein
MRKITIGIAGCIFLGMMLSGAASAGEVEIVKVKFERSGDAWRVNTTLRHADSGWDHYADAWRVVSEKGDVLGTRTLLHPHENEQPFTRSLGNILMPKDISTVFVEAHDKVHGWAKQRVRVDLNKAKGDRFEVRR